MLLSNARATKAGFFVAAACLLFLPSPSFAHHGAFYKKVFRAIEEADVESIKALFPESAWEGKVGDMSAAELQRRLKQGTLPPIAESSQFRLAEYSSYGTVGSRCLVTFKLQYDDDKDRSEQIWILAKRVGDDGNVNPKAWQIVRIVNQRKAAESFLGRKMDH